MHSFYITHEKILNPHIGNLFERVVVSVEVGWRKPHPAIFQHAFRAMDITPEESLFVGDRLDLDVDGAAGAGMDVVWINPENAECAPDHARPQYTMPNLTGLTDILESPR